MGDGLEHHKGSVVSVLDVGSSSISASQMTLLLMLKRKKKLMTKLPVWIQSVQGK